MLKSYNQHTTSSNRRVSVMISDNVNKNLDILANYYEMPKKYVIKVLVDEKIGSLNLGKKEVATR